MLLNLKVSFLFHYMPFIDAVQTDYTSTQTDWISTDPVFGNMFCVLVILPNPSEGHK